MDRIKTKRIYEEASPDDGLRVLVDRLWPRGVKKDRIDQWAKELAPSTELREEFHAHDFDFDEFRARYRVELEGKEDAMRALAAETDGTITLLYGLKDEKHNHAVILAGAMRDLAG
ncbi:MAG: DUF488 family protein [Solirubrobacterales bacterium]|nr:DUF488 family protein [Solirubrobacterales bacterium]OJU93542.1 MAG: hypothetical protein BGO23_12900 [Solirubrobacterales bacterium 67-14]